MIDIKKRFSNYISNDNSYNNEIIFKFRSAKVLKKAIYDELHIPEDEFSLLYRRFDGTTAVVANGNKLSEKLFRGSVTYWDEEDFQELIDFITKQ